MHNANLIWKKVVVGYQSLFLLGKDKCLKILRIRKNYDKKEIFLEPIGFLLGCNDIVVRNQDYLFLILDNGTLWVCGRENPLNRNISLGEGFVRNSLTHQIGTDTDWKSISFGNNHIAGLKTDGTLWIWGSNLNAELGLGKDCTRKEHPTCLDPKQRWISVSCGSTHTIALRDDGTLWGWGYNGYGQLGLGIDMKVVYTPTQIGTDDDWRTVVCAGQHSMALKRDGSLWVWGMDEYGVIGGACDSKTLYFTPKPFQSNTKEKGEGSESTKWKMVATTHYSTLAIRSDGTLWGCGINEWGQLGPYHDLPKVKSSSAINESVIQLGTDNDWEMVSIEVDYGVGVKSDNTIWIWGGGITSSTESGYYCFDPKKV